MSVHTWGPRGQEESSSSKFWHTALCAQKLEFQFTSAGGTGEAKIPKKREVQEIRPTFYITLPFKIPRLHNIRSQKTNKKVAYMGLKY